MHVISIYETGKVTVDLVYGCDECVSIDYTEEEDWSYCCSIVIMHRYYKGFFFFFFCFNRILFASSRLADRSMVPVRLRLPEAHRLNSIFNRAASPISRAVSLIIHLRQQLRGIQTPNNHRSIQVNNIPSCFCPFIEM